MMRLNYSAYIENIRVGWAMVTIIKNVDGELIHAELASIYVVPEHRHRGFGKALMEDICKEADEYSVKLYLTVASNGYMSDHELVGWYKKYGFAMEGTDLWTMYRNPNQTAHDRKPVEKAVSVGA